jgi:YidC/Oxa1 family membrane protein insertase
MDKKNLTLGILFIGAAFATLILGGLNQPKPVPAPAPVATATGTEAGETQPEGATPATAPSATLSAPTSTPTSMLAALANDRADATATILANEFVTVRLTDFGGAIQDVAFKKYPATQGAEQAFVFNERRVAPMLAIAELPGLGANTRYELVSATASEVVYRAVFENRFEFTRRYVLPRTEADGDPYRIRHETTVRNLTDATIQPPRLALELGTTTLLSANDNGLYLNVATYDGEDAEVLERKDLQGGGFFHWIGVSNNPPKAVLEQSRPIVWAAVKNQFFASIYTPDAAGQSVAVRNVELPPLEGSTRTDTGITAAARFDLAPLAPGASLVQAGHLYVGPKEYTRLNQFDHREDKVMQFDRYFFNRIFLSGVVAPLLNKFMVAVHDLVGNWGMAIILMTIGLKVITLPLTLAASKSAKRMGKLSEPMKAIREKYKDNPKKQQEATLALFKEHKVNPAGGCIPILITMPLFIGFFAMLMGTAELRFQSFLWVTDLSAPDTVWRIPGLNLPLNIMPLLMGATMIIQMRLTPQPTTAEGPQVMMMKIMPWVFTLICYNFAAGLALYSTINGIFTIGQQLAVNKFTKDEPVGISPASIATRTGKALKNVTPKNKK